MVSWFMPTRLLYRTFHLVLWRLNRTRLYLAADLPPTLLATILQCLPTPHLLANMVSRHTTIPPLTYLPRALPCTVCCVLYA